MLQFFVEAFQSTVIVKTFRDTERREFASSCLQACRFPLSHVCFLGFSLRKTKRETRTMCSWLVTVFYYLEGQRSTCWAQNENFRTSSLRVFKNNFYLASTVKHFMLLKSIAVSEKSVKLRWYKISPKRDFSYFAISQKLLKVSPQKKGNKYVPTLFHEAIIKDINSGLHNTKATFQEFREVEKSHHANLGNANQPDFGFHTLDDDTVLSYVCPTFF